MSAEPLYRIVYGAGTRFEAPGFARTWPEMLPLVRVHCAVARLRREAPALRIERVR